jgi:O-methyltransferase
MKMLIARIYRSFINLLILPLFLRRFLKGNVGQEYSIGIAVKLRLLWCIFRNVRKIPTCTSWWEHVVIAESILCVPASLEGVVVECGCFKGASAASLSLACSLVGRRLTVFDSFSGLPEPTDADRAHHLPHYGEIHTYEKGAYSADMQTVMDNLKNYGAWELCDLIPGFFNETLLSFKDKCVLVFADVDLRDSLEICVRHLFPLLGNNCKMFSHEAHHIEIAKLFFDEQWWKKNMGLPAPGLVGAGTGLAFNADFGSCIGYAIKHMESQSLRIVHQNAPEVDWGYPA